MVTGEAVILWTGLLVVAITAAADYTGAAVLQADMRNWFGQLSAPIRIAIFVSVGVTLWLVAFTVVSRIAAWLRYSFDPAYESQRMQRRWVQQLKVGDRLRLNDRGKGVYCTISGIDPKEGKTFEVTWNDGHKNTLSYFDADLFDEITLGGCRSPGSRVRSRVLPQRADRLARQIEPGGYLVLGAAEIVVGLTGRRQADKCRRSRSRAICASPGSSQAASS